MSLLRRFGGWTPSVVVLVILLFAVGLPAFALLRGVFLSAVPTSPTSHFTWDNLAHVFASTDYLLPLGRTLLLALIVSFLTTLCGTGLAFLYVWGNPYLKRALRAGLVAPMFVSPVLGVVAWKTLALPGAGLLNRGLAPLGFDNLNILSVGGAVFVMTIFFTPIVFTFVSEALERIGAEIYEAATVAGGSRSLIFNRITLRLMLPASVSAFFLVVVLASEMYTVPSLLAAQDKYYVLSQVIFDKTTGYPLDYPGAATLSIMLLVIVVLALIANTMINRRRERYTTVTGKGARRIAGAGSVGVRTLMTIIAVLYIVVTVVLPIIALVIRSFLPFFSSGDDWAQFAVTNWTDIFSATQLQTPLINSLMLSVAAIAIAIVLGGTIAYLTVRRRNWMKSTINALSYVPLGFPGTVFAIGLIWAFIGSFVYKSIYIVAIAIFVGWLPIVVRMMQTAVIQSSPEFEEAADIFGASPLRKFVRVVFPLLRTSLFVGASLAVVFTLNEVSGAAIVGTGGTQTLAVQAFHYIEDDRSGAAAALGLIQIVIMAIFSAVLLSFAGRNQARTRRTRLRFTTSGEPAPESSSTKSIALASRPRASAADRERAREKDSL